MKDQSPFPVSLMNLTLLSHKRPCYMKKVAHFDNEREGLHIVHPLYTRIGAEAIK